MCENARINQLTGQKNCIGKEAFFWYGGLEWRDSSHQVQTNIDAWKPSLWMLEGNFPTLWFILITLGEYG